MSYRLILTAALLAWSVPVRAAVKTWTGAGGDSNWYTGSNWSPAGAPTAADDATIDAAVAVTVAASSPSVNFASLTLGDPAGTFAAGLTLSTAVASGGGVAVYRNSVLTLDTTALVVLSGDVTLLPGSVLTQTQVTADPQDSEIHLSLSGTFDLQAGATVAASGLGFPEGTNRVAGVGPGGGGNGHGASKGGGGGGHGGAGGAGTQGVGGVVNDAATNPVFSGSGGGGGGVSAGGQGGGLVVIAASSISVNGAILADGGPGLASSGAGGGGAGGGVQLTAGFLTGWGLVSASGGAGGTANGGGGGGGIVSISISTSGSSCSLAVSTAGGAGSVAGGGGLYGSTVTLSPPVLSGVSASTGGVVWTWPSVIGGSAYQLFSSTGGAGQSPVLGSGATFYLETGLLPNTTFTRTVQVSNCAARTNSASASFATLANMTAALPSPFTKVFITSATAAWAALPSSPPDASSKTAEGYRLEASSTNFGALAPGGLVYSSQTAAVAASTLTLTGLDAGTTYYFRVASLNWASQPNYRVVGTTTTFFAVFAPALVSPSFPTTSSFSVTAQWGSNSNPSQTRFTLQASTAADFSGFLLSSTTFATSFQALALLRNTTYFFQIRASSGASVSAFTNLGSTATLAAPPGAFAVPFAGVAASSMAVSWAANGNPLNVTSYTVVLTTGAVFPNAFSGNVSLSTVPAGSPPTAFLTGLAPNTTYTLFVDARNWNGLSSGYTSAGTTVTLASPPTSPAVAVVHTSSLTVSWTPVSAAGYELRASSTNFGAAAPGGLVYFSSTSNGGASSLSAVGLDANTTYYLSLGAYNWSGSPNEAAVSSAATLALPVSGQFYVVSFVNVTVNWVPRPASPQSATAEGYVLQAATAPAGGTSDFTGTILSSSTFGILPSTLSLTGFTPGQIYSFRVGTLNWAQAADFVIVGTTLPLASAFSWTGAGGNTNWYNPANWNPSGIPAANNPVTIAQNVSVVVNASSPSISFASLTLGNAGGTVASNLTISTGIKAGGSVTIEPASGLTQATTQLLVVNGDFTMVSGSSLTQTAAGTVNIQAAVTFDLQAGAQIAAVGLGSTGGAASTAGNGPGGGAGSAGNNKGGGGGGHGGAGGAGSSGAGGPANDSLTNPILPGSGGGGGQAAGVGGAGGAGGGLVRLQAAVMNVNGRILTDGNGGILGSSAGGSGGGGAGGGIQLTATSFSGAGVVSSTGGAGGGSGGGGGGGGLVSIWVIGSGSTCGLVFDVNGGTSGARGGIPGIVSSTWTLTAPVLTGTPISSTSIQWSWTPSAGGQTYQVFSSSGGGGQSPLLSAAATTFIESSLLPNTTFTRYVQVTACGQVNHSATLDLATLTVPPSPLASTFLSVFDTTVTVAWAALPASPPAASSASCSGYELDASTTNFGALAPGGVLYSSVTSAVLQSTLTLTGLDFGTTVYLRVGSIGVAGVPNFTTLTPLNMQVTPSTMAFSLGTLDPKVFASTIAVNPIVISNVGNLPVTLAIFAATVTVPSSPWTLGVSSDVETPVLQGIWNSVQPPSSSFSTAITASTTTSGGLGGSYAGDQTGLTVPVGATRKLWLQFWKPVSTISAVPETIRLELRPVYP